jgi:hypothetical protein
MTRPSNPLCSFSTALSAADRDELYADEKAFFGLP